MKSFAVALALASVAAANSIYARQDNQCQLNTVDNPSNADIQASIIQWNADVVAVNNFLNTALSITDPLDLKQQAGRVILNAKDEPCQLGTLSNAANNDGFATAALNCAVNDLNVVFKDHVINNLQSIIDHPDDVTGVQNVVNDINFFRCCNVLKDADLLWTDAVLDQNLSSDVPTFAPRPDACQTIDCSAVGQCDLLDNGGF
jgi:hypothetical protein